MVMSRRDLASRIDHALLSPATLRRDLDEGCRFARNAGVASVCVRPCDLRRTAEAVANSRTAASTVIGFPHGGSTRAIKAVEAREAIEDAQSVLGPTGPAIELDMVVNVGRVVSGDWGPVRDELHAVLDVTRGRGGLLKVIFETGFLNEEQIRRLCEICGESGVDFVKTSTGFGPRGATVDDVRLMREHSPAEVKIKASGGIRTLADAIALIDAGADRIGTSRTAQILDECDT
ncbi:MAG: deoxyribose-phosphate aldolase [Planctomycetaceae bacterium]|nr:deoxyribose-phosphate aldolase [Planctomycetaceae bacterium]